MGAGVLGLSSGVDPPVHRLQPTQFRRLVRLVARRGGDAIAGGRPGRPWALDLSDRVLLVAVYWRTNLTMRQLGPLFGVSHSAAHRVIDTVEPLLALAPIRRRPKDQVAIVDGTLIPTRDHRLTAQSKNYRYSTNLQVAIDANTRLVIALGDPQPGNRNDTIDLQDPARLPPRCPNPGHHRIRHRPPAQHHPRRLNQKLVVDNACTELRDIAQKRAPLDYLLTSHDVRSDAPRVACARGTQHQRLDCR
jgi:hypothetical protein